MGHLYHSYVGGWELKQQNSGGGSFFDVFLHIRGFLKRRYPQIIHFNRIL